MHSMLFTLVPIFIGIVALFVLFGVISTFVGHRKLMNRITDQALRSSQDCQQTDHDLGPEGERDKPATASSDYACSGCGASLSSNTEISPSGDFKCSYCNSWSNVNR